MAFRVTIEFQGYKCLRCGHLWLPRRLDGELPVTCPNPKCRSPYWSREKVRKK